MAEPRAKRRKRAAKGFTLAEELEFFQDIVAFRKERGEATGALEDIIRELKQKVRR